MVDALIKVGYNTEEAVKMVEANVCAAPRRRGDSKLEYRGVDNKNMPLNVYSYFSVPEYVDSHGKWPVFPGVSMTGAHCSVDYGFEAELEKMQRYLLGKGIVMDMPLLTHIKRPYELKDGVSDDYKDEELQGRWTKIQKKYELSVDVPANVNS